MDFHCYTVSLDADLLPVVSHSIELYELSLFLIVIDSRD